MHHQTDEQSSRSEKWQKFSDNLEYAWQLVNASGRRAAAVMETTARVKCRIGYDGGLTTWISAKQIPEVNYHISWIMTKNQYYAENFVLLVVEGFIDLFFMLYFTYVSYIVIAGLWKILLCVQQQYEVIIWVNKHVETRYRLNCHEETCNRKRIHTHFWKTELAKCRRAKTTRTLCKRTGEATPRAAKFGRIDNSRAQSLNWDLWIWKQSPIRYRVAKCGSSEIRDETKLLGAD